VTRSQHIAGSEFQTLTISSVKKLRRFRCSHCAYTACMDALS